MAIDFVKERDLAKLRTAFRSFSKRKSRRWNVHGATAGSRHHFGKGGAIPPRRRGHRRNSRPRNMAMATAVAMDMAMAMAILIAMAMAMVEALTVAKSMAMARHPKP